MRKLVIAKKILTKKATKEKCKAIKAAIKLQIEKAKAIKKQIDSECTRKAFIAHRKILIKIKATKNEKKQLKAQILKLNQALKVVQPQKKAEIY